MREIKFRCWTGERWLKSKCHFCGSENSNFGSEEDGYIMEQYTGLKDKNGKGIYEGDIVKIDGGGDKKPFCLVVFEDGCFCLKVPWTERSQELRYYAEVQFCAVEVIGNIHENPELIEGL